MNLKRVYLALCSVSLHNQTWAFVQQRLTQPSSFALPAKKKRTANRSSGGGRGFGQSSNVEKTYVFDPSSANNEIDEEVAMGFFFETHRNWHPLFSSIARTPSVPAASHLDLSVEESDISFNDESPWVQLPQIPSGSEKDSQMAIVATVLDSFQKALTDIPVNEALYSKEDDENDIHFLEEGRRMLVLNRFQVMNSVTDQDAIFRTCWSEIHQLVSEGSDSTSGDMGSGSLIILSKFDDELGMDLNHFVNTKIRMPLGWLGLDDKFEVSSFERGHHCIRLIHGLCDIPSLEDRDREEEGFQ